MDNTEKTDFIVQPTEGGADPNKYTNSMGRNLLRALFYETTEGDKSLVVYTLKRRDHLGYPSLYRLYLETRDPTEYRFATQYLNGWSHWQELVKANWFQPYLEEWRTELEVLIRSDALANIMATADNPDSQRHYDANKYVLEALGKPLDARKRGRPTKDTTREEIINQALSKREIDEDARRLGIVN